MKARYFVITVATILVCSLLVSNARSVSSLVANPDPIAFGFVQKDGKVGGVDPWGVTCVWDQNNRQYMINIPGQNYYYTRYVSLVTPVNGDLMAYAGSGDNKLIVGLTDRCRGDKVQGDFYFVTYKLPPIPH